MFKSPLFLLLRNSQTLNRSSLIAGAALKDCFYLTLSYTAITVILFFLFQRRFNFIKSAIITVFNLYRRKFTYFSNGAAYSTFWVE